MNTQTNLICSRCNSPLVISKTETNTSEGSLFPQTTTTYRCTNQKCQEEKEKQTEKRLGLIKAKEKADELRQNEKSKEKEDMRKITAENVKG